MTSDSQVILLALGQSGWEADVVAKLVTTIPTAQVRRCVDVTALLSQAQSGGARFAVVDGSFARLDAAVVAKLAMASVTIVGVAADAEGARQLDGLGVAHVVPITPGSVATSVECIRDLWHSASTKTAPPADTTARAAAERDAAPEGRVVAVWGPPGAPGRTTVAVTLAQHIADVGHEVLLVDADTTAAGLSAALCLEAEGSGLVAASHHAQRGALDAIALARLARTVGDRFRVLTGVTHVSRRVELRAASMARVWQVATQLVPTTVVDIGGCVDDGSLALDADVGDFGLNSSGQSAAATALAVADELVVVASCEPANIARLLSHLPAIRSLAPAARVTVVINRVRRPIVRSQSAAEELRDFVSTHTGADDVILVSEDRAVLDAAMARGLTPIEHDRKGGFVRELAPLANQLVSPQVRC